MIGQKKLTPLSQPIKCKTKTNHHMVARVFPRFRQFGCCYFEFPLTLLIGRCNNFGLVLWHSIEKSSLLWFRFKYKLANPKLLISKKSNKISENQTVTLIRFVGAYLGLVPNVWTCRKGRPSKETDHSNLFYRGMWQNFVFERDAIPEVKLSEVLTIIVISWWLRKTMAQF